MEETEKKHQENKPHIKQLQQTVGSGIAINTGGLDAFVIAGEKALKVYTEDTADKTYRVLIEKMHEGAVTLNKDGTVLYCNSYFANLVSLPLQKVPGTIFKNYISDTSKERFVALLERNNGEPVKEEVHISSNDGKEIPVLMSINTLLINDISVLSIIVTDLTSQNKIQQELKLKSAELEQKNIELKKANQNLETRVLERTGELEKLNLELNNLSSSKDKFLSVISHDLRNPLSALLTSIVVLNIKTEDDVFRKIRPLVRIIDTTSHRILQQLNDLLAWAQGQQHKTILNPAKLNLAYKVDRSLELLIEIAAQKKIVLENKVPIDIYINADKIMLGSIIQNLVTNAIKFTPQNGLITVTANIINHMVEISVTDSGIGMEEVTRKNLFTNQKLTSVPGTNNEKGTGLGLVLVKDFVNQNGGTIRVESKSETGTNFIFTMPKFEDH
ncbi:MAG: PAS domain-containing sensor histidine kinase [Ginsengibacter sp.]